MIQKIQRVTYGRTTIPESWIFTGGAEDQKVPIILSVFYVETEDQKILVDAGCNTMPGFELEDFTGPAKALDAVGIRPEEITHLLLTHAHHDHAEATGDFPNAKVYIQQDEYALAKPFIPQTAQVVTFAETCRVAEGVNMVKIGGHTTGSSVVECRLDGKNYVLCGDECYGLYNIQNRIPTATSCVPENSLAFIEKYANSNYVCLLCHQE